MKIKVCGLTDHVANREIARMNGIDLIGFIFYPQSKRFTQNTFLTEGKERTGVFVNATAGEIQAAIREHGLTAVQLHGNESPKVCSELRSRALVLKAIGIAESSDLEQTAAYEKNIDYLLFDTKTPAHGGSGTAFPWEILQQYTGSLPFFLSGGIGPESVAALKHFQHPKFAGIDLNSRFETAPGIKDPEMIRQFLTALNT